MLSSLLGFVNMVYPSTSCCTRHCHSCASQSTNASLTSQLADVQAAAAREKQLSQDRAAAAEQAWTGRNKELLEQLLQKERQVRVHFNLLFDKVCHGQCRL
jgi:small-conductance mechanosensitive channel